jgi:hypothetical protein
MNAEKEELFPVYDATTFFTDMHQILKIIALGNVRTLCHHRLRFLEQVSYMGGTFGVLGVRGLLYKELEYEKLFPSWNMVI